MIHSKTSLMTSLILAIIGTALAADSAEAQRRFQLGGPYGIGVGGGQGLTIGGGYGVQLGGGVRFGTPNLGVQRGGGQGLRYGAPNAGIRIGGGEGFRVGTPQSGIQFGTGNGLQVGQFATQTQPYAIQQSPQPTTPQLVQPPYGQPIYSAPVYQPQTYSTAIAPSTPTVAAPVSQTSSLPVVPQNQFDAARQASVRPEATPSNIAPATQTASDSDTGVSVLQVE